MAEQPAPDAAIVGDAHPSPTTAPPVPGSDPDPSGAAGPTAPTPTTSADTPTVTTPTATTTTTAAITGTTLPSPAPTTTPPVTPPDATATRARTHPDPARATEEAAPPVPPGLRAAAAQAAPIPLAAAAQSVPGVIDRGHLDLVEVTVAGGVIVLSIKDHTTAGGPTFRSPADLQVRVGDRARTAIPSGGAFDFLGPAGSTIHLLPQTEDPNLVWPGWSTERMTPGQVAGDVVTWRLRSVDGPGAVALFTTDQFGSPSVVFDSDDRVPDETTVRINTHAHANWAFAAPGVYRLTFEVAADVAGRGPTATTATYVFVVGDATAPLAPGEVPPPQQGVVPSAPPVGPNGSAASSGSGTTGPGSAVQSTGGARGSAGGAEGRSGGTGIGALPLTGAATGPLTLVGALLLLLGVAGIVIARSAGSARSHPPADACTRRGR